VITSYRILPSNESCLNIPTVLTQTAEEGGATRVLKLRQIEPQFLDRMFTVEDV
jgi:adenine-specific DNA-methyltransferase